MTKKEMDKRELEWQAESDADTMMRYEEIMGDEKRKARAIKKAKERAKDLQDRADAMKAVTEKKK